MITARRHRVREHRAQPGLSLWKETLCGVEYLLLQSSPVYYGFDVPHGDGSGVIVIPGFLETDPIARNLHLWLRRIGYRPYYSGIGVNEQCPNLLIKERLTAIVDQAVAETGRKIHLIGHSLGGIIARAIAVQRPGEIASVITLGSPFRGTVVQADVFNLAEKVRRRILREHGRRVRPLCFTSHCNCEFSRSAARRTPPSVTETAVYTRNDGVVDWRYCLADNPENNFEVPGTHVGLLFNQTAYRIIAHRLRTATS
jgi:pimeloyl-ACP methyl ester carboxylesterase